MPSKMPAEFIYIAAAYFQVANARHLCRILRAYPVYYHSSRTHLSLNKDPPNTRPVEPSEIGNIFAFPQVGGLHHRYTRLVA